MADAVDTAQVREQGGFVEVLLDVDAKTEFEKKYWKGILDAQGKVRPRPSPVAAHPLETERCYTATAMRGRVCVWS